MRRAAVRYAIAALLLAAGALPVKAERPLLRAGTETSTPGEARPSQALARSVVGSLDGGDVQNLDQCLADNRLGRGNYGVLLRAVHISSSGGRRLWFVRPAQTPWCQALYGAHVFRYFLVEERAGRYRLAHRGGGDSFAVFPQLSHGLNDIETGSCNARECWTARWSYDGRRYRPSRCVHEMAGEPRSARRTPCRTAGITSQLS